MSKTRWLRASMALLIGGSLLLEPSLADAADVKPVQAVKTLYKDMRRGAHLAGAAASSRKAVRYADANMKGAASDPRSRQREQFFTARYAPLQRALSHVSLEGYQVLDIGPGTGITPRLALWRGADKVIGFERYPKGLVPNRLRMNRRFQLVKGDFKEADLSFLEQALRDHRAKVESGAAPQKRFAVVANPPYELLPHISNLVEQYKDVIGPVVLVSSYYRYHTPVEYDGHMVPSFKDRGYHIAGWFDAKDFYPHVEGLNAAGQPKTHHVVMVKNLPPDAESKVLAGIAQELPAPGGT